MLKTVLPLMVKTGSVIDKIEIFGMKVRLGRDAAKLVFGV